MKVGDKVWLFDINRRVYEKNGEGPPIYSEHFYQRIIDSENSKSWIILGEKFSKKNPLGIFTDKQKEEAVWGNENRYKIVEKIKKCPIEKLRKINEILS